MISKETIFLTISVLAGLIFFTFGLFVKKREKSTRANLFFLVLVLLGINILSYFFELISERIEIMDFWNKVFYTTLVLYLSLWLLFSVEYKHENLILSKKFRKYLLLLCIVPALTILFTWYDPNSWFLQIKGTKQVGSLSSLTQDMGPLYLVHSVYSWTLVIVTAILIFAKISRLGKDYRLQAIAISIGVLTPLLYNLITHLLFFIIKIPPFQFKLTQLMYSVTAVTFTWGIFGEKFLDIVPIARRIVFDNVTDLIFVFNTEHRLIDANKSACIFIRNGLIGYHDFVGRRTSEIFRDQPELLLILDSGKEGRNEIEFLTGNERNYFDVRLSSIIDKKKKQIGYVAILHDTTEIRNTQEQLMKSEKMAALGGLVAGVAHEINTPVGISVTAASSLAEETRHVAELYNQNKISRTDFKDYLDTANQTAKLILSNMERAATLVQSFKQVSVDQSTEQKRKFKLYSYVEDVIRSLNPKFTGKDIRIEIKISKEIELDSYPGTYSQIITNLILNSLIHGFRESKKGNIVIKAEMAGKYLKIEYTDDGIGIPAENINRIFEPFFTTDKKTGTGLGLSIIYNLVTQKLHGVIDCKSEPGKGTKFSISLAD